MLVPLVAARREQRERRVEDPRLRRRLAAPALVAGLRTPSARISPLAGARLARNRDHRTLAGARRLVRKPEVEPARSSATAIPAARPSARQLGAEHARRRGEVGEPARAGEHQQRAHALGELRAPRARRAPALAYARRNGSASAAARAPSASARSDVERAADRRPTRSRGARRAARTTTRRRGRDAPLAQLARRARAGAREPRSASTPGHEVPPAPDDVDPRARPPRAAARASRGRARSRSPSRPPAPAARARARRSSSRQPRKSRSPSSCTSSCAAFRCTQSASAPIASTSSATRCEPGRRAPAPRRRSPSSSTSGATSRTR